MWIAVVLLLLALDLLGVNRQHRWFSGAVGVTAVTMQLALNLIKPESVVVALNVDHAKSAHKIDAGYLQELTSDATPALLGSRSAFDPELREQVNKVACAGPRQYSASLLAFNWADAHAAAARRTSC